MDFLSRWLAKEISDQFNNSYILADENKSMIFEVYLAMCLIVRNNQNFLDLLPSFVKRGML